jgi:hypothetical protein
VFCLLQSRSRVLFATIALTSFVCYRPPLGVFLLLAKLEAQRLLPAAAGAGSGWFCGAHVVTRCCRGRESVPEWMGGDDVAFDFVQSSSALEHSRSLQQQKQKPQQQQQQQQQQHQQRQEEREQERSTLPSEQQQQQQQHHQPLPYSSFSSSSLFPPQHSFDAWDALPPLGSFDTIVSSDGGNRCVAKPYNLNRIPSTSHFVAILHCISAAASSMFDISFGAGLPFASGLELGLSGLDLQRDAPHRPLYAPQPHSANDQPASMSSGGHVPLFARRSQPFDLPVPQAAAQPPPSPLPSNSNPGLRVQAAAAPSPAAAPAPAKGAAMLLKLLSSGSGSLGASPLTGISNPTYTQVLFSCIHQLKCTSFLRTLSCTHCFYL